MSFERTKMAEELAATNELPIELALRAVNEFFDAFIPIKKHTKDWNAAVVSPSPLVDAVWHMAVLYTAQYRALCGRKFIDHNPNGADDHDAQERSRRYQQTLNVYRALFQREPPANIWPPSGSSETLLPNPVETENDDTRAVEKQQQPAKRKRREDNQKTLTIYKLTGKSHDFVFNDSTLTNDLFEYWQAIEGIPLSMQRFMFKGRPMTPDVTLTSLGVQNNSHVHFVYLARGC